jgi:hypothetical protein
MKSRIAIFEGYGRRPSRRSSKRYGAPLFQNPRTQLFGYGAPLFENPRLQRYGFSPREMPRGMGAGYELETMPRGMSGAYGRRGYYVPPIYGPAAMPPGRKPRKLRRKGYHVKKSRSTAAQVRFKKAAKKCARKARGRSARKGTYQSCMRQSLKKKRR